MVKEKTNEISLTSNVAMGFAADVLVQISKMAERQQNSDMMFSVFGGWLEIYARLRDDYDAPSDIMRPIGFVTNSQQEKGQYERSNKPSES